MDPNESVDPLLQMSQNSNLLGQLVFVASGNSTLKGPLTSTQESMYYLALIALMAVHTCFLLTSFVVFDLCVQEAKLTPGWGRA